MPTLNWDSWSKGWAAIFPKNRMWRKVRSGANDPVTGEPLYEYPNADGDNAVTPELAAEVAAHRFVNPAINPTDSEYCFEDGNPTIVADHGAHLIEAVEEFLGDGEGEGEGEGPGDGEGEGEGEGPGDGEGEGEGE